MPWKKLSPAQEVLMERLVRAPLEIKARAIGYGWFMPAGLKMSTIDALVKMGAVKRDIVGGGANRRMIVTRSQ